MMTFRKILVTLLTLALVFSLVAVGGRSVKAEVATIDWTPYDDLINQIRTETDFEAREALMHEAETMLMDTGAIIPIYYYNDLFMMKDDVEGFFATLYGYKYFMFASRGDADTLRINLSSEPARLDPALNSSVDGACLAVNSFSGLFTYNAEGQLVPDVVATVEISEDALTYTFTLLEGLKWSDGSDFTAKDFEYSWKRAASPETAADYAYMYNCVEGYEEGELNVYASEDGDQFIVHLNSPTAYFLDLCAFPTFFPVNQAEVEGAEGYLDADGNILDAGAWAQEAGYVSNGAYVLQDWKHKESMTYVKNPYWHRADEVATDTLEFMLSADDTAIFAAYNAGDLDFIDAVPSDEIANLLDDPDFYVIDNLGTYYVCINVKSDLFDGMTWDEAVSMRKALALLIDREYIIDTVAQTGQKLATSFIPAGMLDGHGDVFKQNDDDWTYPYNDGYFPEEPDIDGAIELLEAAGFVFEDGVLSADTPIEFEYLTNDTSGHIAIAQLLQDDFAQVGIKMDVRSIDWDTFLAERKDGNYSIARNGWIADFNDPINMLEMWTSESGNNDVQLGK